MKSDSKHSDGNQEYNGESIVLYDGECVLCNSSVNFLLKRDNKSVLYYGQLQGETGQEILKRHGQDPNNLDSVVLVQNFNTPTEKIFSKSTAVLKALAEIGGFWKIMSGLIIVPEFIRDFIYDIVAKYRYSWFGKYDQCRIPSSMDRDRFID